MIHEFAELALYTAGGTCCALMQEGRFTLDYYGRVKAIELRDFNTPWERRQFIDLPKSDPLWPIIEAAIQREYAGLIEGTEAA